MHSLKAAELVRLITASLNREYNTDLFTARLEPLPNAYRLIATEKPLEQEEFMAVILYNGNDLPLTPQSFNGEMTPPYLHIALPQFADAVAHAKIHKYDPLQQIYPVIDNMSK